ncbi:class I SAM-dependent methyltransferase [bacterium]|nr:class I SAM-dependent methyltransferase [bacterium]
MKSHIKRVLPRFLHHFYNRIVSRRKIADRLGSWFELDWKKKAENADTSTWVDVYDRYWEHWSKQDLSEKDLEKFLQSITKGSSVLDAGCGDGYLLDSLSNKCSMMTGVDISSAALQKARKRFGDNILLIQSFIENLPFADNSFDTVVSAHTLEHVKDIDKAVSELKRVAVKSLVILVPRQEYLPYTEDYHLQFFPTEQDLLDKVGIKGARCERYVTGNEKTNYQGDVLLLAVSLLGD